MTKFIANPYAKIAEQKRTIEQITVLSAEALKAVGNLQRALWKQRPSITHVAECDAYLAVGRGDFELAREMFDLLTPDELDKVAAEYEETAKGARLVAEEKRGYEIDLAKISPELAEILKEGRVR